MNLVYARQLVITFIPSILMLVAVAMVSVLSQIDVGYLTRDVAAIANIHPLSGALSNLGIFLWCVAASICLFSAMILRHFNQTKTFWFLVSSGILSAYLMLDDAFMLHEALVPGYFGISEKVVFVILGICVLSYLMIFRRIILETRYHFLLLSLGFLSLSVVIDTILQLWLRPLGHWELFFEDGAKWLGIASWCSYYVHTSYQFVINVHARPNRVA